MKKSKCEENEKKYNFGKIKKLIKNQNFEIIKFSNNFKKFNIFKILVKVLKNQSWEIFRKYC